MTGHHELKANDLVIGDQGWGLKCAEELERARGHVTDLVAALELKSQLAKPPKRKPRRKSQKAMIATAERAGLPVKKLNPDGSVEIGKAGEQSENVLPFDQWRARHVR